MHYSLWVIAVLCLCALLLQKESDTPIRILSLFLLLLAVLFGLEYARILTFTGREVRILLLALSALGWMAVIFLGKSRFVGFLSGIALSHLILTIFFDLKILLR
jgi:hypothetical protein